MQHLQCAFEALCKEAVQAGNGRYVCLMENVPFYGGPEEGGWWGSDTHVVAWQWFQSEDDAHKACLAVNTLSAELNEEARKEFGKQCLQEMDWLEARGLESDFLPEVDGETEYCVRVCENLPVARRGERAYS